ncbi:MAG: alanine--tRNA ligase [Candidatus Moranbacteria bacterium]|nr:alanine--tRNA ligase [Candidatus Moranbacteria bacterium]
MKSKEIRQKYLDFMKSKGHVIVPSASLIPENDPTTLFTGSGMQPMVPYLLGETHPDGKRIADSQKAFRDVDIENIGDNTHLTFFEMLGNWSFGDYFKKEQIEWIFEFWTRVLKFDPQKIYVSVYGGDAEIGIEKDSEAVEIWKKVFKKHGIEAKDLFDSQKKGMRDGRIFYYGDDNWWSRAGAPSKMPNGEPGGPDSEMFFDLGADKKFHENSPFKDQPCHINCDCGRFIEIGNNVFMEFVKTQKGFESLAKKNIDFGGGLERIVMISQNKDNVFDTDLFDNSMKKIEELSGKKRYESKEVTKAIRIIAEHLRSVTFIMGDNNGVGPSNTDQGYIVRRLIRRAIRYGRKLGIKKDLWTKEIVQKVINDYKSVYSELEKNKSFILDNLNQEEKKFAKTLKKGLKKFKEIVRKEEADNYKINGRVAFDLYQTYGFPIEMTEEMAAENDMEVDAKGFYKELKRHKELSRAGSEKKFKGGLADNQEQTVKMHTAAHLLLAGLQKILGGHVTQRGANITKDRLRFDFSHPKKITEEELKQVEDFVNEAIEKEIPVTMKEMSVKEAKACQAQGVFDDRYGNKVKVYSIKGYSKEICGGPHVKNTKKIGGFKISKEQSSGAGVRRIKAVLI